MRGERNGTLSTNTYKFWDAVVAVPVVMIITQLIKKMCHIKPFWVPSIALIIGLLISILSATDIIFLLDYSWAGFMAMQQLGVMLP